MNSSLLTAVAASTTSTSFAVREEGRTSVDSFEQRPEELTRAFRRRFQANKVAWAYFQEEAPWYRRTCSHWVLSAKREDTRIKRMQTLIAASAMRARIGPLRRR